MVKEEEQKKKKKKRTGNRKGRKGRVREQEKTGEEAKGRRYKRVSIEEEMKEEMTNETGRREREE